MVATDQRLDRPSRGRQISGTLLAATAVLQATVLARPWTALEAARLTTLAGAVLLGWWIWRAWQRPAFARDVMLVTACLGGAAMLAGAVLDGGHGAHGHGASAAHGSGTWNARVQNASLHDASHGSTDHGSPGHHAPVSTSGASTSGAGPSEAGTTRAAGDRLGTLLLLLAPLATWSCLAMVVVCVPACSLLCAAGGPAPACRRWRRLAHDAWSHGLCTFGMLAGMLAGGALLGALLGPAGPAAAHLAMLVGMVAGAGLGALPTALRRPGAA